VIRWLWLAAPVLAVTLLAPLTAVVAVTTLAPTVILHTACDTNPAGCPSSGSPTVDRPGTSPAATVALAFAASKAGGPYQMGAAGPRTYDCSSLVQAAYARAGLQLPRTAAEQRDWLAAGHGIPVVAGQEKPGVSCSGTATAAPTRSATSPSSGTLAPTPPSRPATPTSASGTSPIPPIITGSRSGVPGRATAFRITVSRVPTTRSLAAQTCRWPA
jgi:hypothetical protein